jgi:hypothetical protein
MHGAWDDLHAAAALAACPALSASWRQALSRRAATGEIRDPILRLRGERDAG